MCQIPLQKWRIFWKRAILDKNIPTLTDPPTPGTCLILPSTWDPCVFELNFDIKKQLRLRPGDCGFSNVKTKCDESTNYYDILLCILKSYLIPQICQILWIAPLEHIHLITNLKRMLFLNLINCTWDPKFERMLRKSCLTWCILYLIL